MLYNGVDTERNIRKRAHTHILSFFYIVMTRFHRFSMLEIWIFDEKLLENLELRGQDHAATEPS